MYYGAWLGVPPEEPKMLENPSMSELVSGLLLIISYGLLGGMIKYIDQAFDSGVFSRRIAVFASMPAGLLMGAMIVGDSTSATILLSIVFAVALTKKIDNIAFKLGVASLLVIPIVYRHMVAVQWLPLIILTAAGVVDELGNDIGDWIRKRRAVAETLRKPHKDPLSIPQTLEEVLFNRGAMKLTILALAVAGTFPPIYLIAFLAFDATYVLAEKTAAIDLKNRLHISGNGRTHKPKEKQITLQT